MSVLHEIESIEMAGVDPMWIICLPRLVGITSAVICLFIVFDLVSILGGYAVVWSITYLPVDNFFQQIAKAITGVDIAVGMVKAVCFGFIITVTSLSRGFEIKKQITDIPVGTSKAAVESAVYCLISNVIISGIFYL
jgi:phospholipid/cholesterol/gamma-HCH transport system permease protein